MKILLIGNYVADQQYSMQGFANALLTGLSERGIEVQILAPPVILGHIPVPKLGKWLGYCDKFLLFPTQLQREARQADIVHLCDQGNAMYTRYLQGRPHLLTCHDMLAIRAAKGELPDQKIGTTGRIFQQLILRGLQQAKAVVCVTQTTRSDLKRIARISDDWISLNFNGLYRPFYSLSRNEIDAVLSHMNVCSEERFLLHVGGNQFYKNRMGLLRIYKSLLALPTFAPMRLVMAGKPFTEQMHQFIRNNNLTGQVVELADVEDQAIQALYSRAEALIFPSLYEGFGMPVIEAQACGCPVFTSNRPPMTEVGGKAAVYFDPEQPEQAAQIIAENLSRRPQMIEAGFENVKCFTTEKMIDGYIEIYQQLLSAQTV